MTKTDINARYATARYLSSYRADNQTQVRTCDCCGAGLWNVNLVALATGETVALGNDCAERVGLDDAALKAWWADKYAEERDAKRQRKAAAHRAQYDAWEAERAAAKAAAPPAPFRGVENPDTDVTYADALFDLDGNFIPARNVSGGSWVQDTDNGAVWYNPSRDRNEDRAVAKNRAKGFYVGRVGYRTAGSGRRTWADTSEAPVTIEDNGLTV